MIIASVPAAAAAAPSNPSKVVFDRHVRDLQSLPGFQRAGWSRARPGEVFVVFANDGFRRLADNVLRDAVEGVRLVLEVNPDAPAPVPGADGWADMPGEMARALAAMPGIFAWNADSEHGIHTMTFQTYDPAATERLKPLINEHFSRYRVNFWTRPFPKPPA